jgi:hypothetical protein
MGSSDFPRRMWRAAAASLLLSSSCQIINDTDGEFTIVQTLQPDGGMGCTDGVCHECRPGEVECTEDRTGPRTCSALGRWVNDPPCGVEARACLEGRCLVCFPGERRCDESGVPSTCSKDGSVWIAEPACTGGECVAATGRCGSCSPGEQQSCIGQLGTCNGGQQTCQADATWSACDVMPGVDTCEPGNDDSCDGTPNTPPEGACPCTQDQPCGPHQAVGICHPGTSACVDGVPQRCEGAVWSTARDCTSTLDNDCDGHPDSELDAECECEVGTTRPCGESVCRGQQTCSLRDGGRRSAWDACEPPSFDEPRPVLGLTLAGDVWGPALSADGSTLIVSALDPEDLFFATRSDRGRTFTPASTLVNVSTPEAEGTPFLSADGLSLYFYAIRAGVTGGRDIWVATRPSTSAAFTAGAPLAVVNSAATEQKPWLSPDELSIVFDSTRSSSSGGANLWAARRASRAADFGAPFELAELNTEATEEGATLSRDGLEIFFASDRDGGSGDLDVWVAYRERGAAEFGEAVAVSAVNSDSADLDLALSNDGRELLFSSSRDGAQQIYRASRNCL